VRGHAARCSSSWGSRGTTSTTWRSPSYGDQRALEIARASRQTQAAAVDERAGMNPRSPTTSRDSCAVARRDELAIC